MPVSATTPCVVEPVRPLGPARLAHHDRGRMRARDSDRRSLDAVVADHRRGEAHDLPLEARIGRDLLVAGHRRREDGFAEGEPVRADRLAGEHRAVLEDQAACHSNATRPAAIVSTTRPLQALAEEP